VNYSDQYEFRRIRKLVGKESSPNTWILTQDRRFLYHAWSFIAEFEMKPNATALTLHASYAWGLDLSGSAQGAGGVGGLLFVRNHNTASATSATSTAITTAPTYDGNGNITAYINLSNGQVTQRFEYDAFGNELSLDSQLSSSTSTAPSFRFSTKYTDQETNLLYYGYRYLSPELGRWISRDPIGERGGVNVYGMVGNGAILRYDYLGYSSVEGTVVMSGMTKSAADSMVAARNMATNTGTLCIAVYWAEGVLDATVDELSNPNSTLNDEVQDLAGELYEVYVKTVCRSESDAICEVKKAELEKEKGKCINGTWKVGGCGRNGPAKAGCPERTSYAIGQSRGEAHNLSLSGVPSGCMDGGASYHHCKQYQCVKREWEPRN
jgi:RHS repeat-associated protein